MLLSLSFLGIVLSIILLYFNARSYASSIYLGAFFFLVSLYGFIQYVVLYSKSVFLVGIIFINAGFLTYLTGPVLYFYFRSILNDNSRLKKMDLWHLLPMLIFLAGTVNYIFTPWSYKLEVASKLVEDPNFIGIFNYAVLYQIFPKYLVFLSRPVLILVYTFGSLATMVRFIRNKTELKVFSQQKYLIKWMIVLLGFLFILVLSHFFLLSETFAIKDSKLFFTLNFMQVVSAIGLTGLLISIFFFPGILYGLPQVPVPVRLSETNAEKNKACPKTPGKNTPTFETEYLLAIQQKSDTCMEKFQPYLRSDCNLATFAKLTKIPSHHFSVFFREGKQQTFNDYRNQWRIKHAKKLIFDGKSSELSIEGIGLLSGFSSRNAFYNAFKKAEGISPGQFAAKVYESS